MAHLRSEKHELVKVLEALDTLGSLEMFAAVLIDGARSQPADTVPGQPQPGTNDVSEKAQATSRPEDLAVDPRSAAS